MGQHLLFLLGTAKKKKSCLPLCAHFAFWTHIVNSEQNEDLPENYKFS